MNAFHMRFLVVLVILLFSTMPGSAQVFRVVYFDALSAQDEDNLQKVLYSLHEEYPRAKFEVQNFYEPKLVFDARFGADAMPTGLGFINSERKKGMYAPKTKPQFKFVGAGNYTLGSQPKNDAQIRDAEFLEEEKVANSGDVIVTWDSGISEEWDWSRLSLKPNQLRLDLDKWDLKSKKAWIAGYKGKAMFYDGKGLLTKSFVKELKKKCRLAASKEPSREAVVLIIYANAKLESEFSCEKIERELKSTPESFKISHNYEEEYSSTLRPSNETYTLTFGHSKSHDVFVSYRILVEVASGDFVGKSFEAVELKLGESAKAGRLTKFGQEYDLALNVDWLGSECLRVSGEEYGDPDCDCRDECLYKKDFFVRIQGLADRSCSENFDSDEALEFPMSNKMKISFQCEK